MTFCFFYILINGFGFDRNQRINARILIVRDLPRINSEDCRRRLFQSLLSLRRLFGLGSEVSRFRFRGSEHG